MSTTTTPHPLLTTTTSLPPSLPLLSRGKVRDIYTLTPLTLLLITTDRLSAYDVSLSPLTPLPHKGFLLTLLTAHWSLILTTSIPHLRTHFLNLALPTSIPPSLYPQYLGRSMQVRTLTPFPIEAIVRGHLTCEAWDSYARDGTVCGIPFPPGLQEGQAFPDGPIYTPSTKATGAPGSHDEDISEEQAAALVGNAEHAERIKALSLEVFGVGAEYALTRGLVLVDTKFEFGLEEGSGEVVLMDEILTPESSRWWRVEAGSVREGGQEGCDKQYLRDWLKDEGIAGVEGAQVPAEVLEKTERMYAEAFKRLVGRGVEEVLGELEEAVAEGRGEEFVV